MLNNTFIYHRVAGFICAAALACVPLAHAGSYDDILRAASVGDLSGLTNLLQKGLDPNTVDQNGNTLLMLAARDNQEKNIEILLNNRANTQKTNKYGESALALAAYRGHEAIVRRLLTAGARDNTDGWTALHYAAFAGQEKIVRLLVESAQPNLDARAPNGQTAFMLAAAQGYTSVVRFLWDRGVDARLLDYEGRNALDNALRKGRKETADYLKRGVGLVPSEATTDKAQ